jgi:hypothetical protein
MVTESPLTVWVRDHLVVESDDEVGLRAQGPQYEVLVTDDELTVKSGAGDFVHSTSVSRENVTVGAQVIVETDDSSLKLTPV